MEEVKVKIVAIAPLLMNKFKMDKPEDTKAKRRDEQYSPETDAENALYKDENGCYAPSTWVEACLRETAKEFKGRGRTSLKTTILSSVFVEPDRIPLNKQTYDEIDVRSVVIQRNRVVIWKEAKVVVISDSYCINPLIATCLHKLFRVYFTISSCNSISTYPIDISRCMNLKIAFEEMSTSVHEFYLLRTRVSAKNGRNIFLSILRIRIGVFFLNRFV